MSSRVCYGIILAVPERTSFRRTAGPASEITVWPVSNPWIDAALDGAYRMFLVGESAHCSCGLVQSAGEKQGYFTVDRRVAELIAGAADAAGHANFVVHWFSGMFDSEEVLAELGPGGSSRALRAGKQVFQLDKLIWIGRDN